MKLHSAKFLPLLLALLLSLTACNIRGKREIHKIDWITAPAYLTEEVALPVQTGELIGCCTDGESIYILAEEETDESVVSCLSRVALADGTAEELPEYQSSVVPDGGFKNTLGPVIAPDGTMWLYEMWSIAYYDLPEDFDEKKDNKVDYLTRREEFHHLLQLDPVTGRQKKLTDLSDAVRTLDVSSVFDIAGFAVDGGGNIYFAATGGVAVLDSKGKYLFTLETSIPSTNFDGTSGGPLALLPDGSVGVLTIQPGGARAVRVVDVSAKNWAKDKYELPAGIDLIYSGTNGFLFYYVTGGILYGWESNGGSVLLNWSDAGLTSGAMTFAPMDDGKLAALSLTYPNGFDSYAGELKLYLLSPTDKKPEDGKIKLVYGTIGTNDIQQRKIRQFNAENEAYYIELRNYAGDGVETLDLSDNDRENAKKLLIAEVAAGQGPDIWDASLPIDLFARKGFLEDLWPYIDSDPEIDRARLMDHVLECAAIDGKLYSVFNTFSIQTAAISRERWGDKSSWTLDELMKALDQLPEDGTIFGYGVGDEATLNYLLCQNLDYWVDWTTGECRFRSDEFIKLLEVCKSEGTAIPLENSDSEKIIAATDGTDLREGRQLMLTATLRGPGNLPIYDAMFAWPEHLIDYLGYLEENGIRADKSCDYYCQAVYNADICKFQGSESGHRLTEKSVFGALDHGGYASYAGYPSTGTSGSGFILPNTATSWKYDFRWAISAACREKEAAWSFVRQLLLPGGTETDRLRNPPAVSSTYQFPILKEEFDLAVSPQYIPHRTQEGVYALANDGTPLENPTWDFILPLYDVRIKDGSTPISMYIQALAPDEAQMEQFWTLYNSIDHVCVEDNELMNIILEQAQPFFAGDKTVEETADLIQRRATLYVNENR